MAEEAENAWKEKVLLLKAKLIFMKSVGMLYIRQIVVSSKFLSLSS